MAKGTHIQAVVAEARREQVLDAATKVFAERGFHKATIKQIASEAGVSDGTIYNYFTDKSELLLGLLDRINETDGRAGRLEEIGTGDFETFFKAYLEHRMNILKDNLELLQAVLPEVMVNEPLRKRYFDTILAPTFELAKAQFEALQAKGVLRPLDTDLLLRFIPGTLLGLVVLGMLGDKTVHEQWNDLSSVVSDLVLHGLVADDTEEKT